MKTVLKFIKPYLLPFVFCLFIKAVSAVTELAIPRMLAVIIDENVPENDMNGVIVSGSVMLVFALLTFLFNVIGNKVSAHVTGKISRDLRQELFEKTAALDTEMTDKLSLSSLTSRLTSDTYNITNFLARIQRLGIKAPLMLIGGIIVTLTIDFRLALILISILPLVCFTVYKVTKKSIPLYNEEQKTLDSLVRRVDETHSGIRVIKALSKTEYEKENFKKCAEELSKKEIRAGKVTSLTKPINDFIFYMGLCIVIVVGYYMSVSDGVSQAGKLLAFMTYFTVILNNMIMMTRIFVQGSRAIASGARIEEVLLAKTELETEECTPPETDGYIVFDNVSFSYNKIVPNVDKLSFTLKKGETLGMIGATGSGKSTVISLLLRLYDPDEGNIYIDGKNIKAYEKKELYALFGAAFQNDFIPEGTVGSNISFFREESKDLLSRAAKIAGAEEFISRLDEGFEREVTSRGSNLSGGQKQRLLIARAVYSEPEILILDDSSGALDYKTDMELRTEIKNVSSTKIIVSQRIASVRGSNKILLLDEGKLIGEGTHEQLMKSSPQYREIAEFQEK